MTIYEGLTLFGLMIGAVFVIWSFFIQNKEEAEQNRIELEEYEEYQSRIDEVNQKIIDLNEYGEFLKSELDDKHRELLFLYQLINEKEQELKGSKRQPVKHIPENVPETHMSQSLEVKPNGLEVNYNKRILSLYDKGYSEAEIAKMLEIGQGQVNLVLNLFK